MARGARGNPAEDVEKEETHLRPIRLTRSTTSEVRGEAKPYQIRQFLRLVERYNLKLREE